MKERIKAQGTCLLGKLEMVNRWPFRLPAALMGELE